MRRRIASRILSALFTVWAVTTVAFVITHVLPSDPARMVAGPQARPRDVERIRAQLGLDRPVIVRYGLFLTRLVHLAPPTALPAASGPVDTHATCARVGPVHLDLGMSYQQRRPVLTVLGERLPRTLLLAIAALGVQLTLGVTAGVLAAAKKGSLVDHGAVLVSLALVSAPTFLLGVGLQFVLAHKLRLVPLDGFGATTAARAASLVLPALTLGIFGAAYYTRLVRDEMVSLLREDHVRTARAKGLGGAAIVLRHALRNALIPLVTVVGVDLGTLVGGAVVTEHLFRWPGIGALSVTAILDRDSPIVIGVVIVTSTAVVLCNLLVDLGYPALDPRLRR